MDDRAARAALAGVDLTAVKAVVVTYEDGSTVNGSIKSYGGGLLEVPPGLIVTTMSQPPISVTIEWSRLTSIDITFHNGSTKRVQ